MKRIAMSLRPLSDWVLVQMDPAPGENLSAGGIVLTHPALIRRGVVTRIGKGRHYVDGVYKPMDVQVGERVAFLAATMDTKQGWQLTDRVLGKDEALIRQTDILFVIEEGDPRIDK
jgi:co-chaperonin GroES (HSP10)